jgi:hypothetical protein
MKYWSALIEILERTLRSHWNIGTNSAHSLKYWSKLIRLCLAALYKDLLEPLISTGRGIIPLANWLDLNVAHLPANRTLQFSPPKCWRKRNRLFPELAYVTTCSISSDLILPFCWDNNASFLCRNITTLNAILERYNSFPYYICKTKASLLMFGHTVYK